MLALLVLASPNPTSVVHTLTSAAKSTLLAAGCRVCWHDLYDEKFDPVQPTGEMSNTSKRCVFGLCGIGQVERSMYGPIAGSSAEQRGAWLAEAVSLIERVA